MARLTIQLLGLFEADSDGTAISGFDSDKVRALLAYLAVEGDRPHRREKLAGLLWPDYPESSARTSLRRAIKNLRDVTGDRDAAPPYLEITRQTVQFNLASDCQVDAADFRELLKGEAGATNQLESFEKAIDLYRGSFLEGFSVPDSAAFEEWALVTRQSLQAEALRALNWLTINSLEGGHPERALRYARQGVEIDPYREEARRNVMQALASSGQRVQALAQYEELKELLAEELGVEPERETIELFSQIESGAYEAEATGVSLPSGTVTFFFSDIEGSTLLLQKLKPDRYGELLLAHRTILRSHFDAHSGQEIDSQGDAFFVSFPRAKDAVEAAAQIQKAVVKYAWPDGLEVKVRIGLHTGEPWLIDEGYVGMDVHRAARIAQVGHGGQVLLSETTTALVQDELPEGVTPADLGRHRLKNMRRPEAIHQLVIEGLPSEFPELNSLEVVAGPGIVTFEEQERPPREVGPSPYRGLAAFREEDADFFFGRETFTEQLHQAIRQGSLVAVVVGSSGSGKSSTVFAGLMPQLRSAGDWLTISIRPGTQPFYALATALLPRLESNADGTDQLFASQKLADGLRAGEISLFHTINRVLENEETASRLLLILDQFEELYTLCPDPETRQAFTDELLAAVKAGAERRPNPVSIVVTLRADFMGQALTNRPFADAMQEGSLLLGPMNRDELQSAIEMPAELQGAAFEPGLVTRILDDVGEEPGNLPLLEFALTLLWDQMDHGWLTHAVYDEIGRVEGALARYADEFYAGLKPEDQEQARRIFIQLVQPGQGTEDTRRVARRDDLEGVDWSLVQHLADKRLVVTGVDDGGDETVEVVHEALIRGWGQLRAWMTADREFRSWQERLRAAMRAWEDSDRDEGALLRGAPLAEAENWLGTRAEDLSPREHEYIQSSLAERTREAEAERAQQERERALEQASLRRLRIIVGVLVAASIMGIALTIGIFGQRQSALESAAEAQNVALVAGSQAALANNDTDTAIALAWQAVALNPDSAFAQAQLSEGAYAPGTVRILSGAKDIVFRIALSPDDKTLLGGMDDGSVILWDIETGRILWQQKVQTREEPGWVGDGVDDIAFSPDGRFVAAAYDDRIVFWHAADGQLFRQIDLLVHRQRFTFNPRGEQFATIGREPSRLVIWDFPSGEVVGEYEHGSNIRDLVYTADGSAILIASESGAVILIDARTGEIRQEFQEYTGSSPASLGNIALSPDGTTVIGSGGDAGLLVWDFATGELLENYLYQFVLTAEFHPRDGSVLIGDLILLRTIDLETGAILRTYSGHDRGILGLAITADGSRAFSASVDNSIRVWDLYSGQMVRRFAGPIGTSGEVAFSPDGRTVLAGSVNGTAILWDVETGEEIHRLVIDQPINAVAYSTDGRQALIGAGYEDVQEIVSGHIILWDLDTGAEIRRFEGQPYAVSSVAFSPDGRLAASAGPGAMAILWDVETGAEIRRFEDYWVDSPWTVDGYYDVEFSPGGKQIFAAHSDGNIIGWDVESSQDIRELVGHEIGVLGISFSSDGLWLASGDTGSQVILWNTQTGDIRRRLDPTIGMAQPQFSPDGTLVMGSQVSGITSLVHVETGEVIRRYVGFAKGLSFSPDGLHAVIFQAGLVELWRIDSTLDELLTWTRNNRYIPELTCEQREYYNIEPLCEVEP